MINNLVSMRCVSVRDVMNPVTTVSSLSEKSTVQQALDLMNVREVDQLAVYSGPVRQLTGFISLFDLMDPTLPDTETIRPLVRKTIRISADQPLTRAFHRLRQATDGMPALVTDHASRTIGLLHLRDIAAHIVSEA